MMSVFPISCSAYSNPSTDLLVTLVSSSSGSSGVVQAVLTLPLNSVVLINRGEFPLEEVTDSF